MVSIENLSYKIKNKYLLEGVSVQFQASKINLILGPNGAGKSTLIKLISGELKPSSGRVLINDQDLKNISLQDQSRFRAVLSQSLELSFPLTVEEVVLMGRYPHFEGKASKRDHSICKEAMQLFDVADMKDRNYLTLSGGEKQRVQFARVFAQIWESIPNQPRLLLLDEPLTFLDIYYQYDLMHKIQSFMQFNPDLTVIGVVHDLNIAAKFGDTVILIKNGKIFKSGLTDRVLKEEYIFEVFRITLNNLYR